MSIRVVCPNGHRLAVKDEFAGKTGLCPVCKARIRVPDPANGGVSDQDVLGMIGPYEGKQGDGKKPVAPEPRQPEPHFGKAPRKCCARCQREILADTHICPYCHTYIAAASDT
jgi:hypothetical protein